LADQALAAISDELNDAYAADGRPSIPPERLLKASLLMALYSVRSERLFGEQLDYHLLFRWFRSMDLYSTSEGAGRILAPPSSSSTATRSPSLIPSARRISAGTVIRPLRRTTIRSTLIGFAYRAGSRGARCRADTAVVHSASRA
jgi:hypothetical protein